MKVVSFAGSLRTELTNKKLAREAVRLLGAPLLARAEYVDLRDYPMPVYDSDRERNKGIPDPVSQFGAAQYRW